MIILQQNQEYALIGRDSEFQVAIFKFNSWDGILNTVMVVNTATAEETELLRKIAYQYAENRSNISFNGNIGDQALEMFQMCFDEYHTNPEKELADIYSFNKAQGQFIHNAYDSSEKVIDEIIKQVKEASDILVSISMSDTGNIINRPMYTVSVDDSSDAEFAFWNANSWPTDTEGWDLHIIPGYHPSSPSQGRKSYGLLINGATDALISSNIISSVYSPKDSRQEKDSMMSSTWNYMKHPCKVTGKSFQFTLGGYYQATRELVDDAVKLIISTLGAHPEGKYVGISGGFYPTYDFPRNIANRTKKELPSKENRGSERDCMWTYDVLQKENELENAYIPSWFYEENWISFFKDLEGVS